MVGYGSIDYLTVTLVRDAGDLNLLASHLEMGTVGRDIEGINEEMTRTTDKRDE